MVSVISGVAGILEIGLLLDKKRYHLIRCLKNFYLIGEKGTAPTIPLNSKTHKALFHLYFTQKGDKKQ